MIKILTVVYFYISLGMLYAILPYAALYCKSNKYIETHLSRYRVLLSLIWPIGILVDIIQHIRGKGPFAITQSPIISEYPGVEQVPANEYIVKVQFRFSVMMSLNNANIITPANTLLSKFLDYFGDRYAITIHRISNSMHDKIYNVYIDITSSSYMERDEAVTLINTCYKLSIDNIQSLPTSIIIKTVDVPPVNDSNKMPSSPSAREVLDITEHKKENG